MEKEIEKQGKGGKAGGKKTKPGNKNNQANNNKKKVKAVNVRRVPG